MTRRRPYRPRPKVWQDGADASHFLLNLVASVGPDVKFWNEVTKSEARAALDFLGCSESFPMVIGDDSGEWSFDLALRLKFDGLSVFAQGPA